MAALRLFYRFMVRPFFREPVRTAVTILGIALGVAVVLAIDLAGDAATGSFRSSVETLSGDYNLEIRASGGLPESLVGTVAQLPYALRISPRIEDYAVVQDTKQTLPLIGLDLVGETVGFADRMPGDGAQAVNFMEGCAHADLNPAKDHDQSSKTPFDCLADPASVWVGSSLGRKPGERLTLLLNDREGDYIVRGIYSDLNGAESAIVMDIASAQRAVGRAGRVDRILLKSPPSPSIDEWEQRLAAALPAGVQVRTQGAGTNENRQMLTAEILSAHPSALGAFNDSRIFAPTIYLKDNQ